MADLANQEDALDALICGARYGDMEDVQVALDEYKVSPDAVDEQARTALHMASANGHAPIVNLLLDRGANVLAENAEGNTPLHWACMNGQEQAHRMDFVAHCKTNRANMQVIEILMSRGASASVVNGQGRTPIDEVLGKPFQDRAFSIINAHSHKVEAVDADEDPETQEMEEVQPDNEELRPYNKYGN